MKTNNKRVAKYIVLGLLIWMVIILIKFTYTTLELVRLIENEKDVNTTISGYDTGNTVTSIVNPIQLVKEENYAIKVEKDNNGTFFAEFENTYFGTLKIVFPKETKENISVEIIIGEKELDGHVWTRKDTNNDLVGYGLCYYKTSVDIPANTKEYVVCIPKRPLPDFSASDFSYEGGVMPFAYCQMTGYTEHELTNENFVQIGVHTKFNDDNSYFRSDDDNLNRVYDFCKQSVKATTYAGVYVDGYRELGPYEGDAYINQLSHFSVDNNYEMAKETLRYFVSTHTWPTEYVQETILIAYDYYMYTGDIEFISEIFPELESCLLDEIINSEGLMDSSLFNEEIAKGLNLRFGYIQDICDYPMNYRDDFVIQKNKVTSQRLKNALIGVICWYRSVIAGMDGDNYAKYWFRERSVEYFSQYEKPANVNSVVNALYYADLNALSYLANEIGDKDKSDYYYNTAISFKNLYIEKFANKNGLILDSPDNAHSSLQANMFALDFGLVPENNKESVLDYMENRGIKCGLYGVQFLMDSMMKNSRTDAVIGIITNDSETSWNYMMDITGSKLTTEGWNEDGMHTMDWNHAWGTSPVNIISREIVGIKPRTPGCKTVEFEPNFGSLNKVSARVPINNGFVDVEYKKENKEITIVLTSPRQTYLVLDENLNKQLEIDGQVVEIQKEIELSVGTHVIRY